MGNGQKRLKIEKKLDSDCSINETVYEQMAGRFFDSSVAG
jgi:hypothetical protein